MAEMGNSGYSSRGWPGDRHSTVIQVMSRMRHHRNGAYSDGNEAFFPSSPSCVSGDAPSSVWSSVN